MLPTLVELLDSLRLDAARVAAAPKVRRNESAGHQGVKGSKARRYAIDADGLSLQMAIPSSISLHPGTVTVFD